MKYLIRFNEQVNDDVNKSLEIKKFCEENLVDLVDLGYNFLVSRSVEVYYIALSNYKTIEWFQIKEYLIPFFEFLTEKYRLIPFNDTCPGDVDHDDVENIIYITGDFNYPCYYTYKDIIEDTIPNDVDVSIFYFNIMR